MIFDLCLFGNLIEITNQRVIAFKKSQIQKKKIELWVHCAQFNIEWDRRNRMGVNHLQFNNKKEVFILILMH